MLSQPSLGTLRMFPPLKQATDGTAASDTLISVRVASRYALCMGVGTRSLGVSRDYTNTRQYSRQHKPDSEFNNPYFKLIC